MVKKGELKKRAIYVYPASEIALRWKSLAEQSDTSISKFVIEHVENSLNQEDPDYKSRLNMIEESRGHLETIRERDKQIRHLELLVDRLDQDLKSQRDRLFTDPEFSGVRGIDKRLVAVLRESGVHSTKDLVTRLGIKPREVESIKALSVQLEILETAGLVKTTPLGFKWDV
jgi:hypothetical protein